MLNLKFYVVGFFLSRVLAHNSDLFHSFPLGDEILSVNGTSLENYTHREALDIFKVSIKDFELAQLVLDTVVSIANTYQFNLSFDSIIGCLKLQKFDLL